MFFAQLRNVRPTGLPHTRFNGVELPNINLNEVNPGKLYAAVDEAVDSLNITDEAAVYLRRFEVSIHAKDFARYNTGQFDVVRHIMHVSCADVLVVEAVVLGGTVGEGG